MLDLVMEYWQLNGQTHTSGNMVFLFIPSEVTSKVKYPSGVWNFSHFHRITTPLSLQLMHTSPHTRSHTQDGSNQVDKNGVHDMHLL